VCIVTVGGSGVGGTLMVGLEYPAEFARLVTAHYLGRCASWSGSYPASWPKRTRVERHSDPCNATRCDVTPVDDRERPCSLGPKLRPCDDVGTVDPAVKKLDVLSHAEHAAKPYERLLEQPELGLPEVG
jgi:hypothetical protein